MGLMPNSMSNKRTVSYFTWQNSHLCGAQKVSTLVRLAQIQQWEKNEESSTRKVRRPTVRFRDLNSALRMQQNVGHEDERADEAESDSLADSEGEFDYDGRNNEDAKGGTRDLWGASHQPDNTTVNQAMDLLSATWLTFSHSHFRDLLSDTPLVVAKSSQPVPIIQRGPPRRLQESDYTM
ncbi:hypothetical protein BC835DRAFT_1524251 [Cytidiella melzeri]|nr:hypothetical protein BC835DRAFT_1524251 [Cytidiella melzeri]